MCTAIKVNYNKMISSKKHNFTSILVPDNEKMG